MATSRAQRAGIWVIAVALIVGTIFSFFGLILQHNKTKLISRHSNTRRPPEYQEKVDAQSTELSGIITVSFQNTNQRLGTLTPTMSMGTSRDPKEGNGAVIDDATTFAAYYMVEP